MYGFFGWMNGGFSLLYVSNSWDAICYAYEGYLMGGYIVGMDTGEILRG